MKIKLNTTVGLLISLAFLNLSCSGQPGLSLVNQGTSKYTIIVAEDASLSERFAAHEFQETLNKISEVELPLATRHEAPAAYRILIGKNSLTDSLLPEMAGLSFGEEEFFILTKNSDLFILGGRKRGTMYGVFTFLENYLGCRWYTRELIKIPRASTLHIPPIRDRQKPAFEYRMPFYTEACERTWACHNKINGYGADLPAETGSRMHYARGKLGHTFYDLVPPDKYFDTHPEYFSMVNGKRVQDRGQLCLTNPDVLHIAISEIENWLEEDPQADIVSITQNDWEDWCTCPACSAMDKQEESHAATVINFVNAIADSLDSRYPDVYFDTFAYTYTQKPPKTFTVRDNVIVRICHMQPSCDSHPLTGCDLNSDYVRYLQTWRKKGGKMYAWHYVTDFSHYLLPFPNFNAIREDIRFYYDQGVTGIFCQGDSREGGGGEWAELRSFVLAKLLWDPATDVDATIDDFMQGVYGTAAGPVRQYFDTMHQTVRAPDQHFNLFSNPDEGSYLTPEILDRAQHFFDEAEKSCAADPALLKRVKKARLPVYYADLWFQGRRLMSENIPVDQKMLNEFKAGIHENGIIYQSERSTFDSFLQILTGEFRFIGNLKIIGPFYGPKAELLETICPPESEIDFTKMYKGFAGIGIKWQNWNEADGFYVDFTRVFDPDTIGIAYGLCYVRSPRELSTELGLGSNDGVRLYLNDILVHDHIVLRKATPNSDLVSIKLREGWNKILVKIDQIGGGWGMYLSVRDPQRILTFSDTGPQDPEP